MTQGSLKRGTGELSFSKNPRRGKSRVDFSVQLIDDSFPLGNAKNTVLAGYSKKIIVSVKSYDICLSLFDLIFREHDFDSCLIETALENLIDRASSGISVVGEAEVDQIIHGNN